MEEQPIDATGVPSSPTGKQKRSYVRSKYLFPVYDMEVALEIARIIDTEGAGSLSEPSVAMALGLSAKSSGFALRIAAAKQFDLVERREGSFHTTQTARGIFRFLNEKERADCLARSFYNIELFSAIGDRYQGVPLPGEDMLRNLLERELGVKRERVGDAFSIFMKSAKVAGLLRESQGKTYLLREPTAAMAGGVPQQMNERGEHLKPPEDERIGKVQPIAATWNISIDTKDLVGMDAEAIKATMDGLERLAKIVALRERETEEGFEKEKKERD